MALEAPEEGGLPPPGAAPAERGAFAVPPPRKRSAGSCRKSEASSEEVPHAEVSGSSTAGPASHTEECSEEDLQDEPSYSLTAEIAKAIAAGVLTVVTVTVVLVLLFRAESGHRLPVCGDVYGCGEQRSVCESCGATGDQMWFLPLFGEWEQTWPNNLRAVLYFMALFWCFLGVNMVCDLFMASVEEITSARRTVWVEGKGGIRQKFHVKVWNDTLANLSLMALGSSAPEIMVSTMEMGGRQWFAGDLGPSTIVGSAAFNLLLISAVCICSIPATETRMIEHLDVFVVTAVVSVLAYIWLVIVLRFYTPDKIDVAEALVTLGMFPALLMFAFATDRGFFRKRVAESADATEQQIEQLQRDVSDKYGKFISEGTIKMMIEHGSSHTAQSPSRARYRQGITRLIAGDRSLISRLCKDTIDSHAPTLGFKEKRHVVLECAGHCDVPVVLSKPTDLCVEVSYCTSDGEAKDGVRYSAVTGTLFFGPGEMAKVISVPIIDNDVWEPPEAFYVKLYGMRAVAPDLLHGPPGKVIRNSGQLPSSPSSKRSASSVRSSSSNPTMIGLPSVLSMRALQPHLGLVRAKVVILNDDEPGTLSLMSEVLRVGRDASSLTVVINRSQGSCGDITINYTTKDGSAIQGFDYEHAEGTITMAEGVLQASVDIAILKCAPHPEDRVFCVHVTASTEGVLFDAETNGGADSAICEVSIAGRPSRCRRLRRYVALSFNRRRFLLGVSLWREQFVAAFFCNGSPSDQQGASLFEWVFHCVSLFWKFLVALLPPTVFCTGWCCFFVALLLIGLATVVIIDLANLLGCVLGIANEVTAITLVALGTSLPDMFASRLAAQNDDTADNAIGNVTGSNAVNVFLGLGLPWTVATLYWQSQGVTEEWLARCHGSSTYAQLFADLYPSGGLIIPAQQLFYSVGIFTICALICVVLLMFRRRYCGGELGGTRRDQYTHSAALVILWLGYIIISIALSELVPA
ncbi:unnamed protein product [Prorocentrum cordatum]|uniref:Calx-beta domain-containing protein n=1 Tax=Prorocentrum cordatum TaxID=2364126 RepID=A0ABN9Q7Q0_9DINO|nr:unnamed protein product [Polarella glacialis]